MLIAQVKEKNQYENLTKPSQNLWDASEERSGYKLEMNSGKARVRERRVRMGNPLRTKCHLNSKWKDELRES